MQQHIKILGILYLVFGAFGLLGGALAFVVIAGSGLFSGDAQAALITSGVALFIGLLILIVSIPGLLAGWGLLKYRSWARGLTLVLSALNLLNFPLGTALGIYGLWALTQPEARRLFLAGERF